MNKPTDVVLEGLKARLADPYISTYMGSFFLYNYQIFIFAFSYLTPLEKVYLINESISSNYYTGLWIPLLITPVILHLVPFLLIKINAYSLLEENRATLKNFTHAAESKLIPFRHQIDNMNEKILAADKKLAQQESKHTIALSGKDQTIGQLNQKVSDLQTALSRYQSMEKTNSEHPKGVTELYKRMNNSELNNVYSYFNIDPEIVPNVREYAGLKNLTPEATITTYISNINKIIDAVVNSNTNSASVRNNYSEFQRYINHKNFSGANGYLTNILTQSKTLSETEQQGIIVAAKLLQSVTDYTI